MKQSENDCGKLTDQKRAASGSEDTSMEETQRQGLLPAGQVSMQSLSSSSLLLTNPHGVVLYTSNKNKTVNLEVLFIHLGVCT